MTETSSPSHNTPGSSESADADAIRVMVVDDSALVRGIISRTLQAESDIRVVVSASDGKLAINALDRHKIDVIVLDVEMPNMDGLTAIPLLLSRAPSVKIVMASTLTLKGADISLRCLAAGAADYVPKPTATHEILGTGGFKRELVEKVRSLGAAARRSAGTPLRDHAPAAPAPTGRTAAATPASAVAATLRPMPPGIPKVLAIGSSTGGPQALFQVFKHLVGIPQPIVLTQHMPPAFTTVLAEHITRQCGVTAVEAQQGMVLEPGKVYVARGDYHMTVVARGGGAPTLAINQDPPENYCRPAVDPMLRSLTEVYGSHVLAAILTGMGSDGLQGCRAVVKAGGGVIAQDEASCVVWGMPRAVTLAGLCSLILPVDEIGPRLRQLALRAS